MFRRIKEDEGLVDCEVNRREDWGMFDRKKCFISHRNSIAVSFVSQNAEKPATEAFYHCGCCMEGCGALKAEMSYRDDLNGPLCTLTYKTA